MLIMPDRGTSSDLRGRFRYLLVERSEGEPRDPEKAFVVYSDAPEEVFVRAAREIPHTTKYWSVIVTCAPEDREKFISHLDELVQDLVTEFKRGYPENEAPPIHIVCHLDEPNPHLHLTVLNSTSSGRHAKFLLWRRDRAWLEALQVYLRRKYGFISPKDPKRRRVVSTYRTGRARKEAMSRLEEKAKRDEKAREVLERVRNREDLRRAINRIALDLVMSGEVKDRSELVARLRSLGVDVVREGKNYITVAAQTKDGRTVKVRMRGWLYVDHRGGYRAAMGGEPDGPATPEELERLHRQVIEAGQARFEDFARRFKPRPSRPHRRGVRRRGPFVRARLSRGEDHGPEVVSAPSAGDSGRSKRRGVGVSPPRPLSPPMIFPIRPPSLWRWWWRMFPLLPAGAMFWAGGVWRPLRSPGDLLGSVFSPWGVWFRFPGLDRPIRADLHEIMRARVEFDRVREQAREEPRPEPEEAREERESVLAELVRREAEFTRRAEEARRRAEQETERVSREPRPGRGYFPSPGG